MFHDWFVYCVPEDQPKLEQPKQKEPEVNCPEAPDVFTRCYVEQGKCECQSFAPRLWRLYDK